jgi:CDP-diacylglycerol--glycerol-3-phosphate 3-phosphatidyltransferase
MSPDSPEPEDQPMKQRIPNLLTYGRLVLCAVMFVALIMIGRQISGLSDAVPIDVWKHIAFWSFVVAAVTDFLDGYLARRWGVVSMTGAILDPIADKVLVCGAILGLLGLGLPGMTGMLIASGAILFREFAVSALREVLAPKGIKLPVTFLAKTKTTLQLVALAAIMAIIFIDAWWPSPETLRVEPVLKALAFAQAFYGLAAAVTVWTGIEYGLAARKALKAAG